MEENSQDEGLPEQMEEIPIPTKLPTKLPIPTIPTTDFIPSQSFSGERRGYVFKMDKKGIGYYADHLGFQLDGLRGEPRGDERHISFNDEEILLYNPQETPTETGNRNRKRTKI